MKINCHKIFLCMLALAIVVAFTGTPVFADKPPCPNANAIINPGNQTVPEASVVNGVSTPTVVTLDGTNSNPKSAVTCIWTSLSNPPIVITNPSSCTATFTAPDVGSLGASFQFNLTVTESQSGCTSVTDTKTTTINVTNVETNLPPVASATVWVNGVQTNTANEGDTVTLDGTGSSDSDGDQITYAWTQTAGTSVTINNASSDIATFTAPPEQYPNGETLTFTLTVSDSSLSGSTNVNVTVNSVNQPPTAAISPQCPISVNEGATVTLDGSGSSDPDQGALVYQWSQVLGIPNADLTGVDLTASSITFTAPTLTSQLDTMTFGLTVTDNGGLKDSAECDIVILDITPPAIECTVPDPAIWHGSDVTVNCTASDVASGLANPNDAIFTLTTSVSTGTETDNASTDSKEVCDNASNCATAGPYTFKVDKKAPTVSCGTADTAWHATDQSVSCTATDGGSGPASQTITLSTSVANGTETSNASTNSASACDNVYNCATAGPVTGFKIDKKAPTDIAFSSSISDGGSYYFGFVPSVPTCSATDNGSGLQSCNVGGYNTSVGTHILTATATDNVGNQSTKQLTYTILAWTLSGFFQPVDMNGVWNTVKNGATVPLKFQVFAGPTELTDIAVIDKFVVKGVICPSASAATDDIEFTTTGGTSLRYDTVAHQFIQNWQTPKKAGACYQVTMTTDDGTSLTANFELK